MKNILIIYHYIPENVKIYSLEVEKELFDKIVSCNGCYVNTESEIPNSMWLEEFLMGKEPIYDMEDDPVSFVLTERITVVNAGFAL